MVTILRRPPKRRGYADSRAHPLKTGTKKKGIVLMTTAYAIVFNQLTSTHPDNTGTENYSGVISAHHASFYEDDASCQ